MTAEWAEDWRLPGCSDLCSREAVILMVGRMERAVRVYHDPLAHERYGAGLEDKEFERFVRTGPLVIDLDRQVATLNDEVLPFFRMGGTQRHQKRAWDLLAVLAERCGRTVSYEDLAVRVQNTTDSRSIRHNLRVIRSRLRAILGPAAHLVVVVPDYGYRLERVPS